jgi:hypothetical protein
LNVSFALIILKFLIICITIVKILFGNALHKVKVLILSGLIAHYFRIPRKLNVRVVLLHGFVVARFITGMRFVDLVEQDVSEVIFSFVKLHRFDCLPVDAYLFLFVDEFLL